MQGTVVFLSLGATRERGSVIHNSAASWFEQPRSWLRRSLSFSQAVPMGGRGVRSAPSSRCDPAKSLRWLARLLLRYAARETALGDEPICARSMGS
eukprot:5283943-Pleurochrysis_carterae.AAC.11